MIPIIFNQTSKIQKVLYLLLVLLSLNYSKSYSQTKKATFLSAKLNFDSGYFQKSLKISKLLLKRANHLDSIKVLNLIARNYRENHNDDSASFYYHQAISINKFHPEEKAWSYLGQVEIALDKFSLEDVKKLLEKAENSISPRSNFLLKGFLSLQKAKYYDKIGNPEVNNAFNKAFTLLESYPSDLAFAHLYFIESFTFNSPKKVEKSLKVVKNLIQGKLAHHSPIKYYHTFWQLFQYHRLNQNYKAIDILENELLAPLEEEKEPWAKFLKEIALIRSAEMYLMVKNYYQALENTKYFIKSINSLEGKGDNIKLLDGYLVLPDIYRALGRKNEALKYLSLLNKISKSTNNPFFEIWTRYNSGKLHIEKGEASKGLLYMDSLSTKLSNNPFWMEKIKYQEAKALISLEEWEKGLNAINLSIKINKDKLKKEDQTIIKHYLKKVMLLSNMEKKDELQSLFIQILPVIDLADKEINMVSQVEFLNMYISFLIEKNQNSEALNFVNLILQKFHSLLNKDQVVDQTNLLKSLVRTLELKSIGLENQYNENHEINHLHQAVNSYDKGVGLIKKSRSQFNSPEDHIWLNSIYESFFENAISLNFKLSKLTDSTTYEEAIFRYYENAKSNSLLATINRNLAINSSNLPDSILLKITSIKKQISFLQSKTIDLDKLGNLSINDSTELAYSEIDLTTKKTELIELNRQIEKNFPRYYQSTYQNQSITISTIQKKLKYNESVLEYFVSKEQLYCIIITKELSKVIALPSISEEEIQTFQEIIQPEYFLKDQNKAYTDFTTSAYTLYDKLLAKPLSNFKNLTINKLYIIPDKELNYMPFELFINEIPSPNATYGDLPYLVRNYAVSYGYSATILFNEHEKENSGHDKIDILAVAPSYTDFFDNQKNMASLEKFRDSFSELLYNKVEVNLISNYFESKVLKSANATEKEFMKNIKDYDILHLAMHAFVDNNNPANSKFVFSLDSSEQYDNYLHGFELYNMYLDTKMAVLSACNTGLGSLASGEGVMSLARAFTFAGAESVVMSHWRVDDQSTSNIMEIFYRNLSEGKPKDEAMRLAKLDFLANCSPNNQHPFFWNNFTIIGDIAPLNKPNQFSWYWGTIPLLLIIGVIGFFMRRNSTKIYKRK